jgi:hypothetical protein
MLGALGVLRFRAGILLCDLLEIRVHCGFEVGRRSETRQCPRDDGRLRPVAFPLLRDRGEHARGEEQQEQQGDRGAWLP